MTRRTPTRTCPTCKKSAEVHFEGWFYDHPSAENDGTACSGSGQHPEKEIPMPDHTALEFSRAACAVHPSGHRAIRGKDPDTPWAISDGAMETDEEMAGDSRWRIVQLIDPEDVPARMVERLHDQLAQVGWADASPNKASLAILHQALAAAFTIEPARPDGAKQLDSTVQQATRAVGIAMTDEQRLALSDHLAALGLHGPTEGRS